MGDTFYNPDPLTAGTLGDVFMNTAGGDAWFDVITWWYQSTAWDILNTTAQNTAWDILNLSEQDSQYLLRCCTTLARYIQRKFVSTTGLHPVSILVYLLDKHVP
jgi:hypothetical protein